MANAIETVAATFKAIGAHEGKAPALKAAAVQAYKDAGEETPALKAAAINAYMVGSLSLRGSDALAQAAAIVAKKGFGAKAIASARRTEKQEQAYMAARKALQRIREAAGVVASDNRGKASKAPAPARKEMGKKPAQVKEISPAAIAPEKYLQLKAAEMMAFAKKRGKEMTVQQRNAIADAVKILKACGE